MARRHAQLLFRRELLDFRRERRVFRRLFLQPLVFIVLMSAPVLLVQRAQAREHKDVFDVAVQGPVDAVPGLAEALDRDPLNLERTTDATRAVVGETAEVAIVVPDDAGNLVARGETVPLRALLFSTSDVSDVAGPALDRRLAELRRSESERMLRAADAPPTLASPLAVDIVDVATTSTEGIRFGLAQALPVLLVIQLFGLVNLAQERLAGAKDRRVLEPLLVLPVARRDILVGVGAATMVVGAVSSLLVFVPMTVALTSAVASLARSASGPIAIATSLLAGAVTLTAVFTCLGLMLGARAGSGSEGSIFAALVQVAVFAIVVAAPFFGDVAAEGPILAAPVLGPMLFVREGVASGAAAGSLLVLVGSQLALAAALLRAATAALDRDRNVLRTSS